MTTNSVVSSVRLTSVIMLIIVTMKVSVQALSAISGQTKLPLSGPPQLPSSPRQPSAENVRRPELDPWRDFDELRGGLNVDKLQSFFLRRPQLVVSRLFKVATIAKKTKDEWDAGTPDPAFAENASYQFDYVAQDEMDDGTRDKNDAPIEDRGTQLVARISSLGPVAVKIAQTLSQRADIVGDEVSTSFKRLQTNNIPFDDELAVAVIKESLNWKGPISPEVGIDSDESSNNEPLFAWISEKPVAVASLGQVYKARTHDGTYVAVKVQRPDGMALLAQDTVCFQVVLASFDFLINLQPGRAFDKGLLGDTVNRVATDMTDELNYFKEAKSGVKFEESLSFLGFVKTPKVVEKYSSERVLVTEFVQGDHLDKLSRKDGLAMTRMAVEACTASLVLTGFVHADPHEGNLMLDKNGNIVFLDFGLMSGVEDTIMEAFAQGIQACLAEDWESLTKAFKSSEFISDPIEWKPDGPESDFVPVGYDPVTGEDLGLDRLSKDLEDAMCGAEGGTSRFGALATVLNSLSDKWKMATPPYVLLLIRTFLTLEGIAGRVDPDFNIYEMAMPWAIRRSLSPSTIEGITTLRSTILTEDNRIQWSRVMEFVEAAVAEEEKKSTSSEESISVTTIEAPDKSSAESAKTDAMNDAVTTLLGSPEGFVLRRLIRDLDSIDLVARLLSKDAKQLRKQAIVALAAEHIKQRDPKVSTLEIDTSKTEDKRPLSEESLKLREKQLKWKRKVTRMLIQQHLIRQLNAGPKAWFKFTFLSLKLATGIANRMMLFYLRRMVQVVFPKKYGVA